jgi:uncharacterized membrane protein YuzA (DUF378 family)
MNVLRVSALPLAVIGALNWGLVGLFNFNLVSAIFGEGSVLSRIVYVLVGIAGAACIGLMFDNKAAVLPISRDRDVRRAA